MAFKWMRARAVVAAAAFLAFSGAPAVTPAVQARSAAEAVQWPQSAGTLRPEKTVVWGQLPNGLRYAIMANKTPSKSVALRLRIGAGSLDETDSQKGLAHFLEHMAFNGSAKVPEGDMVKILERYGLAFGPDTNAFTSFEETVYQLDLPTNGDAIVDQGLMLMNETARNLTLAPESIERERGVIKSEERLRNTPAYRAYIAGAKFVLPNARLTQRVPIGDLKIISSATRDQFLELYRRGYRPDRAVLVVVGFGLWRFAGRVSLRAGSRALFAVSPENLPKPTTEKREWGGVIGGPIIRNKMHFFVSVERQVDNPNRTRVFPTRPSLGFSIAEDRTDWNTMVRVDHQINKNHTWAVRWLREWAPQWYTIGNRQTLQSYQDETDLDQTAVGTLTSVVGNAKVNTVRLARTWEHWWHGNECFRAQGSGGGRGGFAFGSEDNGNQALCPPQLDYISFLAQASTESQGPWDSNYQVEDDFTWFVPGKAGDHDLKFGARYNYTELRRVSQINMNGTFRFNTDLPFDAADPRTYPERFTIRTDAFREFIKNHTYEFFAQDKWHFGRNTINVGIRYDLEIIPMDETGNPLFAGGKTYPVDKNNISPRIGFTRALDANNKSVIRAGWGVFYNRTILGWVDDAIEFAKFTNSLQLTFPNNNVDPGPSSGRFPTDPYLANGPFVNRALLNATYPQGALLRNTGDVIYDTPNRKTPYAHQVTVGYVRELTPTLGAHADVIYSKNKDMFLARNLYPMLRADTTRTGAITRSDAFGLLNGESYSQHVWAIENWGESDYKALNLALEKRYSSHWQGRISYSLSKAMGTSNNQADKNLYQTGSDLRLDAWRGPSDVDRRHILSIGARVDVPKTAGANVSKAPKRERRSTGLEGELQDLGGRLRPGVHVLR